MGSPSDMKVIGVAQGGLRDAFAFVATMGDSVVVVAFRGSVLPLNYVDDEFALPVPWQRNGSRGVGGLLHAGFI